MLECSIQYGYIIEAAISYYPIRNGWKLWYGKNGLFYYKSIQDCRSYDLQNIGLKIHNFSLELKQSKTPPAASCWIISTLVRRYVFFNPRFCKSWDCPNIKRTLIALLYKSIFRLIRNQLPKEVPGKDRSLLRQKIALSFLL